MKVHNWKLYGLYVLCCLLMAVSSRAQSGLCKSSFRFNPANQSNVVINPGPGGAYSQLYNVNGFTWEAWFRLRSNPVTGMIIMSVEDNVVFQDVFLGFGYGPTPNALNFHITDNGATNAVADVESVQAFTLNTWYHVAGICDYANAQLKLYLNGNLLATAAIPTVILQNRMSQNHLAFIGNASASLSAFNGDIDEVRYWSTVRTQAQLQQNSTACLSLPQTGLVAYFKADETTGTSTKSAANNNFAATLQNAGWSTQYPGDACYLIDFTSSVPSCKTLDVQGSITNAVPITTWQWDWGDGNVGTGQNTQHTYAGFGSKNVKLILTDNNGCKDSTAQLIDVQSFYISKIIDTAICAGTSFAGYSSTGVYNDILPSTDGCDTMRKINLTVKPKPFVGKDTALAICEQSTINLSTLYNTAAYSSVIWNTPNATSAVPGSYTLQVTNAQGCSDTANALVQSIPIIRSTVNVNLCEGQSYAGYSSTGTYTDIFTATGGCDSVRTLYLQVSSKYNTVIDTTVCAGAAVAGYSVSGTYTDQFNSVQGCDSIRTLHLTVLPLPVLNIGVDTTICTGDSILLDAGLFNSYTWQDGSTGRYLKVKRAGRYSVIATNDCGQFTDDIFVQESPCVLQFPTAFSPNGDHNNDVFKALSVRKINNYHLVIYNRWGQKVFETRNVQQGWDGQVNGKPAGTGSFVWYCEYSMTNLTQPLTRKGVVTLLR